MRVLKLLSGQKVVRMAQPWRPTAMSVLFFYQFSVIRVTQCFGNGAFMLSKVELMKIKKTFKNWIDSRKYCKIFDTAVENILKKRKMWMVNCLFIVHFYLLHSNNCKNIPNWLFIKCILNLGVKNSLLLTLRLKESTI